MIDFIKLNISYLSKTGLLQNSLFTWSQVTDLQTGEMKYPIKGKYKNLDIKINPTRKELSGSIHKLRNELKTSQNQNYDDFRFIDFLEMVQHLKDVFNLDLNKTIIENLEIGMNIHTDKEPERILNENLVTWNYMTPTKNKTYNGTGKYIEYETSQYYFKIYDKGKQYDRTENILRIEYKVKRNEFSAKLGIRTLSDLTHITNIEPLTEFLYRTFDMCLIVDNLTSEYITEPKDRELFIKGTNPFTWATFKNRATRKRLKDNFERILKDYKLDTIKIELSKQLKIKGEHLMKCYEMNDFQNTESEPPNDEMLRNETYIYIHNVTPRKCKITGIDITHQKEESKFVSAKTVIMLFDSDRNKFNELMKSFSPKNPDQMSFTDLCKEVAHNVRNRDSNKRHEIKRKTDYYRNSLFPLNI